MSIRLDLHIHTESHGKALVGDTEFRESIVKNGLDGVAITNFFDISHAKWLKKRLSDCIILVGQEIWTKEGHILGVGLEKRINDKLFAKETIALIHEQGGIAIAPHPFLFLGVGEKALTLSVDAVEIYNGVIGMSVIFNYLAEKMAKEKNIPPVASTDTTDPRYIGWSYTEVLEEKTENIFNAIRLGKVRPRKRALPIPYLFILKNFLNFKNFEPSSLHPVPCIICKKSIAVRLFKTKHKCIDCGKEQFSRISCCNGHFFCMECTLKRGQAAVQESKSYHTME